MVDSIVDSTKCAQIMTNVLIFSQFCQVIKKVLLNIKSIRLFNSCCHIKLLIHLPLMTIITNKVNATDNRICPVLNIFHKSVLKHGLIKWMDLSAKLNRATYFKINVKYQ